MKDDEIMERIQTTLNALDTQTPGVGAGEYETLYYFLWNGISDIVSELEETAGRQESPDYVNAVNDAAGRLKLLQIKTEEIFIRLPEADTRQIGIFRHEQE